jgi:hypothetical protein
LRPISIVLSIIICRDVSADIATSICVIKVLVRIYLIEVAEFKPLFSLNLDL